MEALRVIVANDLRIIEPPRALVDAVVKRLTYSNPAYAKAVRFKKWSKPEKYIQNYMCDGLDLRVPRGFAKRLRVAAKLHGLQVVYEDRRTTAPVEYPCREQVDASLAQLQKPVVITERQQQTIDALVDVEQTYLLASTGYGKSYCLLLAMRDAGQRCLFLVPSDLLRTQVIQSATAAFGPGYAVKLKGKRHDLAPVMVATYNMAWGIVGRGGSWADELLREVGTLVCDEAHLVASPTRRATINMFGARYRWGATATDRRQDGLHGLMFDLFGQAADHVTYEEAIEAGRIVRVRVRAVRSATRDRDYEIVKFGKTCSSCDDQRCKEDVPADKRCECGGVYEPNPTPDAALNSSLYALADSTLEGDPGRTAQIADIVKREHDAGHSILVMARHIDHSQSIMAAVRDRGVGIVFLRGGATHKKDRERNIEKLRHGEVRAAVGTSTTYTGMDVDRLDRGIVAVPAANNPTQLKQMRGRFCRLFDGKDALLYYLWDSYLFPQAGRNLKKVFGDDVTFEEDDDGDE